MGQDMRFWVEEEQRRELSSRAEKAEARVKELEKVNSDIRKMGHQLSEDYRGVLLERNAAEDRAKDLEALLRRAGTLLSKVPLGQIRGTFSILREIVDAIGDWDPEASDSGGGAKGDGQ